MTIREAEIGDVDQLVQLGLRFRATTSYVSLIAENPDQMRRTAEDLITRDDAVIFVSEDRGGLVTGMIGLVRYPHHLSGALTCGEVFWYIAPESRGDGVRLLRQAEQWARNHGATVLEMIQPVGTEVDVIYRRYGYQAVEVSWQKRLIPIEVAA